MVLHGLDWIAALAPLAGWPDAIVSGDCRDSAEAGPLRKLVTRFLIWRAQRETVRILSSVDSATLRDLGITNIESEVYGAPEDRMRGYDPCWWRKH
jgi:uncharacterized protein YjiS (DUF1127 family)